MIRYRMLLAQGMVSPPYATQHDRGVTGGGKMMRIGDREVLISGMPFGILLVYARLDSLIFTLVITAFFYMLERRGMSAP